MSQFALKNYVSDQLLPIPAEVKTSLTKDVVVKEMEVVKLPIRDSIARPKSFHH